MLWAIILLILFYPRNQETKEVEPEYPPWQP